jgi:hypothetical protein
MSEFNMNVCMCPACQGGENHPDRQFHQMVNLLMSRLDERQRRWFAGLEAHRLGHGGDRLVATITGLSEKTVRRGRREMLDLLTQYPPDRIRRLGGGRASNSGDTDRAKNR